MKKGFIDAGIDEKYIDEIIKMFNYYQDNITGIKTDVIGAIGNWFKFDCIDVVGVLDSYHGGNVKSTVRMVLNPSKIKIKNLKIQNSINQWKRQEKESQLKMPKKLV